MGSTSKAKRWPHWHSILMGIMAGNGFWVWLRLQNSAKMSQEKWSRFKSKKSARLRQRGWHLLFRSLCRAGLIGGEGFDRQLRNLAAQVPPDHDQVADAAEKPIANAVIGTPGSTGMMLHRYFFDHGAHVMRQNRHEPVQSIEAGHVLEGLTFEH